jgi:hypothetical protein
LKLIHFLPLKEHSTAGEGLPFPSCNLLTYFTYDAPAPSTEAAAKSQFCATAHVEYTQSGFATDTTTTTVEVRNGSRRGCDAFGQSAEQCVGGIVISTNTNSTLCICTRARTPATEARASSNDNNAGPHHRRNIISQPDTDLYIEPVSIFHVCIRTTTGWFLWFTAGIRGRLEP